MIGVKTDCFAYNKDGWCIAMRDLYCKDKECKFYKTEKDMCKRCKAAAKEPNCKECKQIRYQV